MIGNCLEKEWTAIYEIHQISKPRDYEIICHLVMRLFVIWWGSVNINFPSQLHKNIKSYKSEIEHIEKLEYLQILWNKYTFKIHSCNGFIVILYSLIINTCSNNGYASLK